MRRFFSLAAGWTLVVVGILCIPLPFPPLPIGMVLIPLGAAILTARSRTFRRAVQRLRHRSAWFSRRLEQAAQRAPKRMKTVVRRTSPQIIARAERRRAARAP